MHGMMRLIVAAAMAASCSPSALAEPPTAPARATNDADESGLRFYAQQNDRARVEAEMRRLKALYPGWAPPDDLWIQTETSGPDEGPLWELFAADRIDELKVAIETRREAEPGWEPSRDLSLKIRQKAARAKVMALSGEQQWKKLAELARTDPSIAEIGDVDVLWLIADAHARAKQADHALNIYKSVLATSEQPPERIGTIQKAMASLPMREVETLIGQARIVEGRSEFAPIQGDISRMRISAYLHDERKDPIPEDEMKRVEEEARASKSPDRPGLVAWYRYKRKEFTAALDWFKLALTQGGDAMIAHGLAHTLRELGMYRETEEIAHAWREGLTNNRILFVDILETDLTKAVPPYVEPERLARYGRAVMEDASGEGAQALAWYAYNSCQFEVAREWFERAVAWMPKQETVYGYALVLRRLKKDREFVELVNRYDGLFPKVLSLLFPHDFLEPPTPCEIGGWDEARWWEAVQQQSPTLFAPTAAAANKTNGVRGIDEVRKVGPGPYSAGYEGYVPGALHDPLMRHSWGLVTGPTGRIHPQWRPVAAAFHPPPLQKVHHWPARDVFPVVAHPENPLRFLAQGSAIQSQNAGLPFARETFGGPYPFLARRVDGADPMPYEKYGVTLSPNPAPGRPLGDAAPASGAASFSPGGVAFQARRNNPVAFHGAGVSYETTSSTVRLAAAPAGQPALPMDPLAAAARAAQERMSAQAMAEQTLRARSVAAGFPAQGPGPLASALPAPGTPLNAPLHAGPVHAGPVHALAPASPYAIPAYPPHQAYPNSWTAPAPAPAAAPVERTQRPRRVEPAQRPRVERAPARGGGACSMSLGASGSARELSPSQAVANGWCFMNAKRPAEAAIAFERGLSGQGRVAEDAAYGKSLALLQSNDPRGAALAAQTGSLSSQRRSDIGVMALEQRIYASYNKGDYVAVLQLLEQRSPHAPETRDLTLMRGWALYQLGRLDQAERIFLSLDRQMSTKESRSGIAAIDSQRLGKLQ